jgi:hypothetical protein
MRSVRTALLCMALVAGVLSALPASAGDGCGSVSNVTVPGAERQQAACLADLTTAGTVVTGHTNANDWAGLHAAGTSNPSGVPGVQVDGYFPDSSTTNTHHGWNHDAQFVIRLPAQWNGGLVVTGAPGVRRQYANDFIIGDWVLPQGYAFASTDKGNTGADFYKDGAAPGDAIAEWHARVTELTRAARSTVTQAYGHHPRRVYMTGISNGGYLARWQLENAPQLYDGGVDWEGTFWHADGPHLLTYLPTALREYPRWKAGLPGAHSAMLEAGFAPGSEFLWDFYYTYYWDLTQRIYREELDPSYDGATEAGTPFCPSGTPACDADYDYFARPPELRDAVDRIALTGKIKRPMLTLHGTLDSLLPIRDTDVYRSQVVDSGRSLLHRYYRIEAGNHVDGLYTAFPTKLRPILPCYRTAFTALVAWVEGDAPPPPSRTIPRPASGDLLNTCPL